MNYKTNNQTRKVTVKFLDYQVTAQTESIALNKIYKTLRFDYGWDGNKKRSDFNNLLDYLGYEVIVY
jgi:hypothetical protein